MSFAKSLVVGVIVGLVASFAAGSAMLSTSNQGEFVDPANGEWTAHFYGAVAYIGGLCAAATTALLTVIGFLLRSRD